MVMLTRYSQDVLDLLRAKAPELAGFAQIQPDGSFTLQIPTASPDLGARVTTVDDKITLWVDLWHTHMGMEHDEDHEAEVEEFLLLLEDLRTGRKVITVWLRDGKWAGSGLTPAGEAPAEQADAEAYTVTWSGARTSFPLVK